MFRLSEKLREDFMAAIGMSVIVAGIFLWTYFMKGMYPFGRNVIAWGDMPQQSIAENFYYLWDILHGQGKTFFSWKVGMGINIIGAAAEQGYLSPLNLFLLLSSRRNLLNFVNIMVILKAVCMAFSMYFYLRAYDVGVGMKIVGSVIYALGAACLVHYQIIFVMDAAFIFPILIAAMRRMMLKKKCGAFIIVSTACLVINIYMSVMIFLFVFIAGWLKISYCFEKEQRKRIAFLLSTSVCISVLLSAVVTLPSLVAIMNSSRGAGLLQQLKGAALSGQNDLDLKGCMLVNTMLPLAVIIMNAVKWKYRGAEYQYHKWVSIILLCSLIIPGTELMWHGGTRVAWPVRYVFLISFALIDFSFYLLQHYVSDQGMTVKRVFKPVIWTMTVIIAGITVARVKEFYIGSAAYTIFGIRGFCLLLCGLFLLLYIIMLNYKKSLLLIFGIEMVCGVVYFIPEQSSGVQYILDAQAIKDKVDFGNTTFGHVKIYDHSLNDNYSFIMDCQSIANFMHVIDEGLQDVFRALGYSTVYTRLLDTGGTVFTDALMNERYVISKNQLSKELYQEYAPVVRCGAENYYIYQAKYSFPPVLYMNDIQESLTEELFENQNIIFNNISDENEVLIEDFSSSVQDGHIMINIPDGQKKIMYIYCDENCTGTMQIMINGCSMQFPEEVYPSVFYNNMIEAGCFEGGIVDIQFIGTENFDYNKIHIGLLDMSLLKGVCENLNRKLRNISLDYDNDGLMMDVPSSGYRYLFVPVPYDSGWKCKVNEKNQKIQCQYGFIAVPMEDGDNHIELKYMPNGRMTGWSVTFGGMFLYIIFAFAQKIKRKRKVLYWVQNIIYYIYFTAFVCMMSIMYLIPGVLYFMIYLF